MADRPSSIGAGGGGEPEHETMPRTPRWVKLFAAIALVVLLLLVVMVVVRGGGHGPGRHMESGEPHVQPPPGTPYP